MPADHLVRRAVRDLFVAALFTVVACAISSGDGKPSAIPTLRWGEDQSGCTFSRDDDGKYRYGLWTSDFGIVLAVDSQELEKSRRRSQPILALHLTAQSRGGSLELEPEKTTLEFVKHYHDVHNSLNPDDLENQQRREVDVLAEQTERDIGKHPEKKEEKEAILADRRKDAAQMIEFLEARSLRHGRLDSGHPEAEGWLYFSTKSKWIDELRKQEEFVLRVPLAGRTVEFPFSLPPSEGDLILRRRPDN
jgi:hypothetical protein